MSNNETKVFYEIKNYVKSLMEGTRGKDELWGYWTDYCEANGYYDEEVYSIDDIEEHISSDPVEAFNQGAKASGMSDAEYFKETIYGFKGYRDLGEALDDVVEVGSLADFLMEHSEEYDNIQEIRDDLEEEEDIGESGWEE